MEAYTGDEYGLASSVFSNDAKCYEPDLETINEGLEILVVFTDASGTRAALQMAEGLAQKLEAHIRLLVPYEVPYALPLDKPAVSLEFLETQILSLAYNTHMGVVANIYLCRDKRQALGLLLHQHSLIVVGGQKRWWPTSAQKLARALHKDGHQVIFAELM